MLARIARHMDIKPEPMLRIILPFIFTCAATVSAQTYFYIDAIEVQPQTPTPADNVSIQLIGGLSSTGAFVSSSSAQVVGSQVIISITAQDPGGLTVIVPHTEVVQLGQLAAGTYTISFNAVNVGDFAPEPQHTFTVTGAGVACDSVFVYSVERHPFLDDAIVVHSYHYLLDTLFAPHFVLLGQGGDTLAQEANPFPYLDRYVDYWHTLQLEDGVNLTDNTVEGSLQFFSTGFIGAACTFNGSFDLCPPATCIPMMPTLINVGGGITLGDFAWNISDEQGDVIAIGTFTLTDEQQADTGNFCLEPGSYTLVVLPLDEPSGGQPYFGVSIGRGIDGPQQALVWSQPEPLAFDFYGHCAPSPQSVQAYENPSLFTVVEGGTLHVWETDGRRIGPLRLFDVRGTLIAQDPGASSDVRFPLGNAAAGLYVLNSARGRMKVQVP